MTWVRPVRWAVAVLVLSPWLLVGVRALFGGGAATGVPPAYLLLAGVLCCRPAYVIAPGAAKVIALGAAKLIVSGRPK